MNISDIEMDSAEFPNSANRKPKDMWSKEWKRQVQLQYIVTWYLEEYYSETLDELQGDKDCLEITDITISADDGLSFSVQTFNES